MAAKTIAELREQFETGDTPTMQDFRDLFDTFVTTKGENWPATLPAASAEKLTNLPITYPIPINKGGHGQTTADAGRDALLAPHQDTILGTAVIEFTADADMQLSAAQERCRFLMIQNTAAVLTAGRNVATASLVKRDWVVVNSTGQTITFKTPSGTGVAIPTGHAIALRSDGANVLPLFNLLTADGATLTNPTVTGGTFGSPAINTPTVTGGTFGAPNVNGGTVAGATVTNPTLSGGSVNDTPIGATTPNTVKATTLETTGAATIVADAAIPVTANRLTNDGTLVSFKRDGTQQGVISVAGATVTYGAFLGTHWAQLSRDAVEILPLGAVLSTIDELCEWVAHEWVDVDGTKHHELYDGPLPVGAQWTEVVEVPQGGNEEGEPVEPLRFPEVHTVVAEFNDRLARVEVSRIARDPRVYGVFGGWDEDGDIVVHSLGAAPAVRVTGPCAGGDLLVSRGDGTAMVDNLADVRTVIGKVTIGRPAASPEEVNRVPAVLYCG